ncbi:PTS sugar transporter subunit IIC, partial [Streptococcus agalactiae]|nr:PTS sugar transporter subunit IIC [Streptococcus agalactiae]
MHSTIYKCHHCRYLIYKSFKDIFPFALIFSWIEILQKLVISDDSFLAQTTKSSIYKNEWLYTVSNTLYDLSHLLIYFMASYFVASLVWRGLSNQTKESFSASLLGFATVWLLLTSVVPGTDYHYPSQPIWLMLALISYLFIFLTRLLQNRHHIFQYSMLAILLLISSI